MRVTGEGAFTVAALTAPDTVTDLLAANAELSTAVMVTTPALLVAPAAMVRVVLALSVKSDDVAGEVADAETVTVTSTPAASSRVAVTALTPPSSVMTAGSRARVTLGAPWSWRVSGTTGCGASPTGLAVTACALLPGPWPSE